MTADAYRRAERDWWQLLGVEPREHWVTLHRWGIRVRVQEVGEGPPLLFLHGTSIAGTCFADLVALLPDHRCLLLDRPGCGLSQPFPEPPGLDGLPAIGDELVPEVLDGLDVPSASVVSNSMGGYFALRAAATHPERVSAIVHLGWALGAPAHRLPLLMRLATFPGLSQLMASMPVTERMARQMLRAAGLGPALDAGVVPAEAIAWNVAVSNQTPTRRHEWRLARGASVRRMIGELALPEELLARVACPVLVLFGTEDPFGTTASMQALADGLPDGELVLLDGAGHAPWLEAPDDVADRTRRFLARSRVA